LRVGWNWFRDRRLDGPGLARLSLDLALTAQRAR